MEHDLLASPAPDVLAANLLAATRRIRIGTGRVMLQHYSPLKVAEAFRALDKLAPGRADLGIGNAPGGLPCSTLALQAFHDKTIKPVFDSTLAKLNGFLQGPLRISPGSTRIHA
jgi:alkanesulfonate monooxygenase SsuD/methylene tetrahydromethanopterin reductase-like flavin-dependent oxidoreductase (luciferase family)